MNKKLNLTLILLSLSLLLISCEPQNNISKSNIQNKDSIDTESNTDVNQKNNADINTDVNQTPPRETFIIAGVGHTL